MAKKRVDYILLIAVLILVVLGLLFVYSASNYSAQLTYGNKYFFLTKQLVGALIGLVAMTAIIFVDVKLIKRLWIAGVVLSVVLLCLVFVPGISIENYGAKRWIGIGGFSMQPSEIAKFAYVLFCAVYMSKNGHKQASLLSAAHKRWDGFLRIDYCRAKYVDYDVHGYVDDNYAVLGRYEMEIFSSYACSDSLGGAGANRYRAVPFAKTIGVS